VTSQKNLEPKMHLLENKKEIPKLKELSIRLKKLGQEKKVNLKKVFIKKELDELKTKYNFLKS
jgi:hypothetical protein